VLLQCNRQNTKLSKKCKPCHNSSKLKTKGCNACVRPLSPDLNMKACLSLNDLGWKGPYRPSGPNPPALSRDIFHQTRLFKALSNLALNTAREGAATASWATSATASPPSEYRRTTEWLGLEATFKGHLVQPPCSEQGHLQLDEVAQSPVQPGLECFQAVTTSLDSLCQCLAKQVVQT